MCRMSFRRRTHVRGSTPLSVTLEAWLLVLVIAVTWWLLNTGIAADFTRQAIEYGPIAALLIGAFYSVFVTTPIAVAGFFEISTSTIPLWQIAAAGALGATLVDLLLLRWVRSPLAALLVHAVVGHDIKAFHRRRSLPRWAWAMFGAVLISIPLPTDELGVVFMGASHLRTLHMVPIIYVADFIGIYAFISISQAVIS